MPVHLVEAAMKHALCLILAILCLDVSLLHAAADDAQPFPKDLIDPAFLRQLTWRADKRLENAVAGWPAYSGDQGFQGKISLRQAHVRILGSLFEAEYLTYKMTGDAEILINYDQLNAGFDAAPDCGAMLTWVERALGLPKKVVDLSTPRGLDLMADWLFGETRVQFGCSGVWLYGRDRLLPASVSLRYNHRDRLAVLEEPFHLECSSQAKYVGLPDKTVSEEAPLILIVDPNHKRLLLADRSNFGETETFTDEEIIAVREDEEGKSLIRINRVTANYRRIILLKSGSVGIDQWGTCVRVAPGKKF
jgi:hypothetical protein